MRDDKGTELQGAGGRAPVLSPSTPLSITNLDLSDQIITSPCPILPLLIYSLQEAYEDQQADGVFGIYVCLYSL